MIVVLTQFQLSLMKKIMGSQLLKIKKMKALLPPATMVQKKQKVNIYAFSIQMLLSQTIGVIRS